MIETLRQDYVRTARAKGVRERRVLLVPRAPQRADPGGDGDRRSTSARCSPAP